MKTMSSNRSSSLRQFAPVKYKKAPQAPRRFKSSYMFFSTEKHKEIRAQFAEKDGNQKISTTEVAKLVSQAWKSLSEEEREKWEDMARQDKARYEMEKSMYTGPWKVPATKRIGKDPKAPKRPMSAFLSFSNSKRSFVKKKHKDAKNAEVSRILAQMWKDASENEKKKFIDEEFSLRQQYKIDMAEWKRQSEEEIKLKRAERENEAIKAVREGKIPFNKDGESSAGKSSLDSVRDPSSSIVYSTKMADETFGPNSDNTYSTSSQSYDIIARPGYYGYSKTESSHYDLHQNYPQGSLSSHHNINHQTTLNPYSGSNGDYWNYYGTSYPAQHKNQSLNEGSEVRADLPLAYNAYGHPHPYGYAPQYYRHDYTHGSYEHNEHSAQHNHTGSRTYYNYDPNYGHYDQDQSPQG